MYQSRYERSTEIDINTTGNFSSPCWEIPMDQSCKKIRSHNLRSRLIATFFCTDSGATLDLHASKKDNSSVDNHPVICTFFVLK